MSENRGKWKQEDKKKDSPGSAADLGSDERGIWELREKNKSLHISNSKNQTQFLK